MFTRQHWADYQILADIKDLQILSCILCFPHAECIWFCYRQQRICVGLIVKE